MEWTGDCIGNCLHVQYLYGPLSRGYFELHFASILSLSCLDHLIQGHSKVEFNTESSLTYNTSLLLYMWHEDWLWEDQYFVSVAQRRLQHLPFRCQRLSVISGCGLINGMPVVVASADRDVPFMSLHSVVALLGVNHAICCEFVNNARCLNH